MIFNKYNARKYGCRGGLAAAAKRNLKNFDYEKANELYLKDLKAFEGFEAVKGEGSKRVVFNRSEYVF